MGAHDNKVAGTSDTVQLAEAGQLAELSLMFRLAAERDALVAGARERGGRRAARSAYQAAEAIEQAINDELLPLLGQTADAAMVMAEWSHRRLIISALGWEGATRVRNKVSSPERPLLICRGEERMHAGSFLLGSDGCGLVYRGQWRRRQRDGVDAYTGPRCERCNHRLQADRDGRRARDAALRNGINHNIVYATVEGQMEPVMAWVGRCPGCGNEWASLRAWQLCAHCVQRGARLGC